MAGGPVAIIYHSEHHQNTKKLLDAIRENFNVDLFSPAEGEKPDLSQYKLIGFASGVYKGQLHQSLLDFVNKNRGELEGKNTFIICTSGSKNERYVQRFREFLEDGGMNFLGSFHRRGYNTFGPFKLIGGINRGRPSKEDMEQAVSFYEKILTGE